MLSTCQSEAQYVANCSWALAVLDVRDSLAWQALAFALGQHLQQAKRIKGSRLRAWGSDCRD